MINEVLQWLVIAILAIPKIYQVISDFKNEDDE